MNSSSTEANKTFLWLWLGQLISNIGTQTSLYGIGLWFFANTQRLMDFGLVAITVQLARILVLPLLGNRLHLWSRRKVMLIANGIGALCTIAFAAILLQEKAIPLILPLLFLQGVAAMAEAALILSFSSLIPILIIKKSNLIRANGLFASTDSLVLAMAPFLGSWISRSLGLQAVLTIDALSFLLALICVLAAPWSRQLTNPITSQTVWQGFELAQHWRTLKALWTEIPLTKVALIISIAVSFSYAATEILFPAWVAIAYGSEKMALVILIATIGYCLGILTWQSKAGLSWKWIWLRVIFIQSLILMGAGLQIFANKPFIWFGGVFVFSAGLPIVMSSLQQAWSQLGAPEDLPRIFALRYSFDWSARLIAFITVSIAVDQIVQPALSWQNLPSWIRSTLGFEEGRAIAVVLGAIGWVLFLSSLSQKKSLRSTH